MAWDEIRRSGSGLAYRRGGDGKPLVLLHGIPGAGAAWRDVVLGLDGRTNWVVPDLLGFGTSEHPTALDDLHASAQAIAVERLLDEIGITSAVVVGHDFGGPVAVLLANRRPDLVAAVGLLAANLFADTPIPFPLSAVTWPLVGVLAARALFSAPSLALMLRRGAGSGAAVPDAATYIGDRAQQRTIATIFSGSLTRLSALYAPVEAALGNLTVPAFVGWGDRDPFFSVARGRQTAEAAGATFRLYEGAGHFLPHERPDDVSAGIRALVQAAVG